MTGNIAIPYADAHGPMRAVAAVIADGLGDAGCDARLIDVAAMQQIDWQALDQADAIVLGTPVVLGSVAAVFKSFIEDCRDIRANRIWTDKLAAGFCLAAPDEDSVQTALAQLAQFSAYHGMIWVGHAPAEVPQDHADTGQLADTASKPQIAGLGLSLVMGADSPDIAAADAAAAHDFALRIARAVRRWRV